MQEINGLSIEAKQSAGRYRIYGQLAAGGMATVYLGRTEGAGGFGKLVAIKRIHPHLAKDLDFVQMFMDEAKLVARITHPNVCSVLDFGETEDTYFLAMEYIMGETLLSFLAELQDQSDYLTSKRWHAFTAYVIAEACEGLHAAHELRDENNNLLNVIHRDVSPDNIFVTFDGAVQVVDFGIARAEGRIRHTQTGVLKGKVSYMAPEALEESRLVDRRVDIWALGVCLWEMLTGKRLFRRNSNPAIITAILNEPIPRPSAEQEGVPPALEEIVMQALERDPDKRPATARELGRMLKRFVAEYGEFIDMAEVGEIARSLHADSYKLKHELRSRFGTSTAISMVARPATGAEPGAQAKQEASVDDAALLPAPVVKQGDGTKGKASGKKSSGNGDFKEYLPQTIATMPAPKDWKGMKQEEGETTGKKSRLPLLLAVLVLLLAGGGGAYWYTQQNRGVIPVGSGTAVAAAGDPAGQTPSGTGPQENAANAAGAAAAPAADAGTGKEPEGTTAPAAGEGNSGQATDKPAGEGQETQAAASDNGDDGDKPRRRRDRDRDRDPKDKPEDTATAQQSGDSKKPGDPAAAQTGTQGTQVVNTPKPPDPVVTNPVIPAELPKEPPKLKPTNYGAKAALAGLSSNGSLPKSQVERAVGRQLAAFQACYEPVAKKAEINPTVKMQVNLEIDEDGGTRDVKVSGGNNLPGLAACVTSAANKIRSGMAPDVGTVKVSFTISYAPLDPVK